MSYTTLVPPRICNCESENDPLAAGSSCPAGTTTEGPASGGPSSSVLLSSGQFTWKKELLSIPALGGMGWSFGLDHLSASEINGPLGLNFNFPQFLRLEGAGSAPTQLELFSGQNTVNVFDNESGVWTPASGNTTAAVLTQSGSAATEIFTLAAAMGRTTVFYGFAVEIDDGLKGKVKSVTDRMGNSQTFSWINILSTGTQYEMTGIADSYGREVTYRYEMIDDGMGDVPRIVEIEDFLGRKLNFQYDAEAKLVAVVTPSILEAADGNTFPDGTAYVFEYEEATDEIIKIYYPNETVSYMIAGQREVDLTALNVGSPQPRYTIDYTSGQVTSETIGKSAGNPGGMIEYLYYTSSSGAPTDSFVNPFGSGTTRTITFVCQVTDRNGNIKVYSFNAAGMPVRVAVQRNRDKINIPPLTGIDAVTEFVTYTDYNAHNQPIEIVYPEGNSVVYTYETGTVSGISGTYNRRVGLMLSETRKPGNTIAVTSRDGSSGQTELTRLYFYDPIFNQLCATIEERGNPIDGSTFFPPQNGGTTPTLTDRSRYATFFYFDYQKNTDDTIKDERTSRFV